MNSVKIGLALISISFLFCYFAGDTFSYFLDSEISNGNSFTAGTWGQSDNLVIDASAAKLTGNPVSRMLLDISIANNGTESIIVAKILVEWIGGGNFTEIRINGTEFWNGSKPSGGVSEGYYELKPFAEDQFRVIFDGIKMVDGEDKDFYIKFWMIDASSKDVSFTAKYHNASG